MWLHSASCKHFSTTVARALDYESMFVGVAGEPSSARTLRTACVVARHHDIELVGQRRRFDLQQMHSAPLTKYKKECSTHK